MERPEHLLEVAFEAANAAARHLLEGYGRVLEVSLKGVIDLVTEYDLASEEIIRKILTHNFPTHAILGEEGGLADSANSPYRWYIDPLDGTTNFTRSHPFFAVSLACCLIVPGRPPRPQASVIVAPVLRESYWAFEGGGARRSQEIPGRGFVEEAMAVTSVATTMEACVCTGFPYDVANRTEQILGRLSRILPRVRAIRRAGAASLDMAYVAAGRADGYFEFGPKAWDLAAGALMVIEAGGALSDMAGDPYILERSESIIASNGALHKDLVGLLK
jgi:myo-inositol-1(or 4)-monophosphatase